MEEIKDLLANPDQNLVICSLFISLADRAAFFSRFLAVFIAIRQKCGHPHCLLMDEAHHLIPEDVPLTSNQLSPDFNNFILISTSPHALHLSMLSRVGMIITLGSNPAYPFEQFSSKLRLPAPTDVPSLAEDEICVW